jgi:hypothetical protein
VLPQPFTDVLLGQAVRRTAHRLQHRTGIEHVRRHAQGCSQEAARFHIHDVRYGFTAD